jgi:hypothetical protein
MPKTAPQLVRPATYQRPVEATLVVRAADGDSWAATEADLGKFNLVGRSDAYMVFDDALSQVLREAHLIDRDITEAALNPVRYLVETAIAHPELLNNPGHRGWRDVAQIERTLQAVECVASGDVPADVLDAFATGWAESTGLTLDRGAAAAGLVAALAHLRGAQDGESGEPDDA